MGRRCHAAAAFQHAAEIASRRRVPVIPGGSMTKAELVEEVSRVSDLTKKHSEVIVDTVFRSIITALQLAAVMQKDGKPLSELATIMKVYPQVLINIDTKSRPEIADVPEIMQAIRDVEAKLGDRGRVLVRYSGTQNLCRVMVEGPTQEETNAYSRQIAEVVKKTLN